MLTTCLTVRRTARINRGGFTLVELLVVIGIIAILAGVALGPITNGIKKAKQSSGLQSAHAIGISMYAAANDNNQLYPYVAGTTGLAYAQNLLAGGYVKDAGIFFVGAANGSGCSAYVGSNPLTGTPALVALNNNWDFLNASAGTPAVSTLDSTSYTYLPIMWSGVMGGTAPDCTLAKTKDITAVPGAQAGFGTDGMAVYYMNNAAKFVVSQNVAGVPTVTLVQGAYNDGTGSGLTYNIHLGGT